MPTLTLYGYSIYQSLVFKIASRTLINVNNGKIKRFGETKARLFIYLLTNAENRYISDEQIFVDVFEIHGLRCSKSYLWRMIRQLHIAFISVGFERAPLRRYEHKGYKIDTDSILEIYTRNKTGVLNMEKNSGSDSSLYEEYFY
jgi:hypothetical protein